MEKITCIICAYNEEERIGKVLEIIAEHPLLDEVIVINDGSTDGTKEVAAGFPSVKLVSYKKNRGKSAAFAEGVAQARNNLLMMIDADLEGLTVKDIADLAKPVLSRISDISISLRKNSLLIYRLMGLDFVSGERVLPRRLIESELEKIKKLPSYGIEVFMNQLTIMDKLRVAVVKWPGVICPRKTAKLGFWRGTRADIAMVRQILKVMPIQKIIWQNWRLWLLTRPRHS